MNEEKTIQHSWINSHASLLAHTFMGCNSWWNPLSTNNKVIITSLWSYQVLSAKFSMWFFSWSELDFRLNGAYLLIYFLRSYLLSPSTHSWCIADPSCFSSTNELVDISATLKIFALLIFEIDLTNMSSSIFKSLWASINATRFLLKDKEASQLFTFTWLFTNSPLTLTLISLNWIHFWTKKKQQNWCKILHKNI